MAYSQEDKDRIFNEICTLIENGMAVRNALKQDGMPDSKTFYDWMDKDNSKLQQYARACELRADMMAEDMLEIADDGTNDYMTITKGDTEYNVEDREVTSRSKLRVEARKWLLSKMNPKKYGDKTDITTNGNEITNVPSQIIVVSSVPDMKEIDG